jgi:hypothetical protein
MSYESLWTSCWKTVFGIEFQIARLRHLVCSSRPRSPPMTQQRTCRRAWKRSGLRRNAACTASSLLLAHALHEPQPELKPSLEPNPSRNFKIPSLSIAFCHQPRTVGVQGSHRPNCSLCIPGQPAVLGCPAFPNSCRLAPLPPVPSIPKRPSSDLFPSTPDRQPPPWNPSSSSGAAPPSCSNL